MADETGTSGVSTTAPAAPVAVSAADTVPATTAAVIDGNTQAFREAKRAERAGKPLAAVPAPAPKADAAAPVAAAEAPRELSRRQQESNDRTRQAVERATADLRAENDRLKAAQPRAAAPVAVAPPPVAAEPAKVPDWKRIAAMPDAPKMADFDGPNALGEYTAAVSQFTNDVLTREHADRDRQTQAQTEFTKAQETRINSFVGQLNEARATDPEFVNKLSDTVKYDLKPFNALKPGEAAGAINVIGEQVYDSPVAPQLLRHFSDHPDDLTRITTIPPSLMSMPPAMRTRAHIQWMVKQFGILEHSFEPAAAAPPQPKTLTDAPAPAAVLGTRSAEASDPKVTAIKRGDTSAYRELKRQERAAARH